MHTYTPLEETFSIHFEADELDLLNFGALTAGLHKVLNQVAITMFQTKDEQLKEDGEDPYLDIIPQNKHRDDALIRARVVGVKQGSLILDLQALVCDVFTRPGAISVIHNLGSSVIVLLARYMIQVPGVVVRYLKGSDPSEDDPIYHLISGKQTAGRRRVSSPIVEMTKALAESTNGGSLRVSSKELEIEVIINAPKTPRRRNPLPIKDEDLA